jgi:inosine triphosphate pyrophosphatase
MLWLTPRRAKGSEPILFEGKTDGTIVPARGPAKFGWDPVFEPEESGGLTCVLSSKWPAMFSNGICSYAEMSAEDKNKISHRYRALEKLRAYLRSLPPA